MCVLFQRCQVYDCPPPPPPPPTPPPFFSTKSIRMTRFFWILCERPHFSDILVYAHIFRLRDFSRLLVGIQRINYCDICLTTSYKWVPKIKGQYMNRSAYWMIKYMNGSVFFKGQVYEWGRFWNTGSHIRTIIVPKLSSPLPTTTTTHEIKARLDSCCFNAFEDVV